MPDSQTVASCWLCNVLIADLPAFVLTQELFHLLCSISPVKEWEWEWEWVSSWVGSWHPAKLNRPYSGIKK